MQQEEIERLRYRRQYIISPIEIEPPFLFVKRTIGTTCHLYTHVDLTVTDYHQNDISLILLGDIFDSDSIHKNNLDLLKDLFNTDFNSLLKKLSSYTGCFVLIYVNMNIVFLVHDATATKKIYHCSYKDGIWCASQPSMLAKILGLEKSRDESKIRYYNSSAFRALDNASIGNTTYYDEISQVLPNHYFDISQNRSIRFWPFERIAKLTLQESTSLCAKLIKGYMESIVYRYKVMLPVTSGKDSRTLLAATRNIQEHVFYYINKEKKLKNSNQDIKIPSELFLKLGLKYHILDPYIPIDKDFKKVYFENNEFAHTQHLPIIYNYYANFSDKVNLPGNIATGAIWMYPIYREKIDRYDLAKINNVCFFSHALKTYNEWLLESTEPCKASNFNLWYLFYWEERLGNWGTQYQMDKEIAQIDINPFNSRLLVQSILSVNLPYILDNGNYSFTKMIINKLWPEVLSKPINPSFERKVISVLEHLGLLEKLYKRYYK